MTRARLAAFTRHGDLRTSLSFFGAGLLGALGVAGATACGGNTLDVHGGGTGGRGERTARDAGVPRANGGTFDGAGGAPPLLGGFPSLSGPMGEEPIELPVNTTCRNPKPEKGPNGEDVGLVVCDGGARHRVAVTECPSTLPRPEQCYVADAGSSLCRRDSDCTTHRFGFCEGNGEVCSCTYGCARDSDCDPGTICLCGAPAGRCVPADCKTDADCVGGMLCLTYEPAPGCPGNAIACQTPIDQCVGDSDCPGGARCQREPSGQRRCSRNLCRAVTGRPFSVAGAARLAGEVARSDWGSPLRPRLEGLGDGERNELAARWTEIALMEHASIAAFARFALELLSLGAPADLVVRAQEAMADEVTHARDAFALASAFAGREIGPGPLDVSGALSTTSLVEVVRAAVLEGCIGEMVAAVEAAEALAVAEDEAVRVALTRVAADEATHAELAFRFVKWALDHAEPALRSVLAVEVTKIVDEAARSAYSEVVSTARYAAPSHGLLAADARAEIRRHVFGEVVVPCVHAIASPAPRAHNGETSGVSLST